MEFNGVGGAERGAGNAVGVDGGAGDVKRGKLEVGTKSERKRLGRGFGGAEPQMNGDRGEKRQSGGSFRYHGWVAGR